MKTTFKVSKSGYIYKYDVTLHVTDDTIYFLKSPFALKDEIKAMKGSKWNHDEKVWSVANCPRNLFQIRFLEGYPVYDHFEQELLPLPPEVRPELLDMAHQVDMVRRGLTYHYQILAAEQGLGKSLVGITLAELSGGNWWYVGPKSAGESFKLELEKWGVSPDVVTEIMTYEALLKKSKYEKFDAPIGVIFDESTAAKNETTNRTKAATYLSDKIRDEHGLDGYVILLSGTPTAKAPVDIWSQAEIAFPGFLREGSTHAFKMRYGFHEQMRNAAGNLFSKFEGWNEEEIAQLPNRYKGLMTVYRKADWLDLPEKKFRRVYLEPSKKVLRVGAALAAVAKNPAIALTWLRALSSGFQYVSREVGEKDCPVCTGVKLEYECPVCKGTGKIAIKETEPRMVKTPKCDALKQEIEGLHRVVVAASFTGSINRCHEIAKEMGFATCVVDGKGWRSYDKNGKLIKKLHPLEHWRTCSDPVCFIGNPGSCRFGLTLIEAKKMIFFDNDFSAENRLQMLDRIHRIGQDVSPEYVDFIHLPVDERVLDILEDNRNAELLSLGAIAESLGEEPEEVELEA